MNAGTGDASHDTGLGVTLANAGAVWCAVGADEQSSHYWPEDVGVFHGTTGETHLLSELPAFLLHLLRQHPWSFHTLCESVAGQCEVIDDDRWRIRLAGMLDELAALELIEQIEASAAVTNGRGMTPAS